MTQVPGAPNDDVSLLNFYIISTYPWCSYFYFLRNIYFPNWIVDSLKIPFLFVLPIGGSEKIFFNLKIFINLNLCTHVHESQSSPILTNMRKTILSLNKVTSYNNTFSMRRTKIPHVICKIFPWRFWQISLKWNHCLY